jgi:ribose 5-phosphate isomerase B
MLAAAARHPSGVTFVGLREDETWIPWGEVHARALRVAAALRSGRAERGVLVCGSGVGVAIAANKVPGIYAGVCHDTYSAHQGVEHDAMNVLALGARVVGVALAREILQAFLAARPSGEERHRRRVARVRAIEARAARGVPP